MHIRRINDARLTEKMSLFLTSDEKTLKSYNSRVKFSNEISQDFFQDYPFNLSLKDVYFDPKFPTLTSDNAPHVITIIKGEDHRLDEFPQTFKNLVAFKSLFRKKVGQSVSAPLIVHKDIIRNNNISEIDSSVTFEIHPRLNIAFSCSYLKDVSLVSKSNIVEFLNSFMFPFHIKKPLKYSSSGTVEINSNLDIYLSQNMLELLGFNQLESLTKNLPVLHFPEIDANLNFEESIVVHKDMLVQMESESEIYTMYRKNIFDKPKGEISLTFSIGEQEFSPKVLLDLDLFNFRAKNTFNYGEVIRGMNIVLLRKYISIIRERVINSNIDSSMEERKNLDDFLNYLVKNQDRLGFVGWGGIVTLKQRNRNLVISPFHNKQNQPIFQQLNQRIQTLGNTPLLIQACQDLFFDSFVVSLSFNQNLCDLFGLEYNSSIKVEADDVELKNEMNYFRCIRQILRDSYDRDFPVFLEFFKSQEIGKDSRKPIHALRTETENLYSLYKNKTYNASGNINYLVNQPKLIFVTCNFVQHSLFGSTQERLLGFFPLNKSQNRIRGHTFKTPLVLKTFKETTFHINLFDENMKPLKADVGTPTLLSLKKSNLNNMFPVTLISSDKINKKFFPENKSNFFKNKLSLPLLISQKWTVSLRTIAFPKIKNIYKEYFNFSVKLADSDKVIKIDIENCYITNVQTLLSLLNQAVQTNLNIVDHSQIPTFKLIDGLVSFETNNYDCYMDGNMIRLLGLAHSYQTQTQHFEYQTSVMGVSEPLITIFQPQEIIVLSNIVEEAFYAQKRPNILKILPVPIQDKLTSYNYIEIEEFDHIPIKLDRIDEIEIKIVSRKGELIEFVNDDDVRIQLEFREN